MLDEAGGSLLRHPRVGQAAEGGGLQPVQALRVIAGDQFKVAAISEQLEAQRRQVQPVTPGVPRLASPPLARPWEKRRLLAGP
ncbi:hypothetical protein GCM10009107_36080 [Ideonella azotifigens]|uniref:Uncharacterized protein n=1 Tax=Ideonella azotifigens TaxID=513160 RepID=A0ABN1K753_9BURK